MPNSCGLYEIRNTVTGDIYIGAWNHTPTRLSKHRAALVRGRHHSKRLQEDWNTYGPDAFAFQVMRILSDGDGLWEEEALAILDLKPAYNTGKPSNIGSRQELERHKEALRLGREKREALEQARLVSRRPVKINTRLEVELECDCGRAWRIVDENGERYTERLRDLEEDERT